MSRLDDVTGGLRRGQVWIVTSAPGDGCSTWLMQMAVRSARDGLRTCLVAPRQSRHDLRRRLSAHVAGAGVPSAPGQAEMTAVDASSWPLWIATSNVQVASIGTRECQVLVVDDADLTTSPDEVAGIAGRGVTTVLGLPAEVVFGRDGLCLPWARVADVVLEVETRAWDWAADPSIPATLRLLKHRVGPLVEQPVWFEPAIAQFRDAAADDRLS